MRGQATQASERAHRRTSSDWLQFKSTDVHKQVERICCLFKNTGMKFSSSLAIGVLRFTMEFSSSNYHYYYHHKQNQ